MSKYIEVIAIVEGKTEQVFIEKVLAPYLGYKNIGISATQVTKPGQKGGDVRFSRILRDVKAHLRQRSDTYVTTLVDYYGIVEWPNRAEVPAQASPEQIASIMNDAARTQVIHELGDLRPEERFIPFMCIHEFEALLFSDPQILARVLNVNRSSIEAIISECGSPEAINNSPQTAPSKRLKSISPSFAKTSTGITLAEQIGIETMRDQCPLFHRWLTQLETIQANA